MSEDTNLEPMVCRRGVEGGGGRRFLGGSQISFEKGKGGICQNFGQTKAGGLQFFFSSYQKRKHYFWIFFLK